MRTYEVMYIVHPNIEEDAKKALVERFNGILTTEGAEILEVRDQGKRHLAYEINDFRDGSYSIVRVKSDSNKITDGFQHLARIGDDIIRYVIIRGDEDK